MVAYGWAAGLTLWILAALSASFILARIIEARDTQIPIDDTEGDTMDWDAFTDDVYSVLGDGCETASAGDIGSGDSTYFAIGETWQGALFGYEENNYGQRAYYRFDTEAEQWEWFDAVSATINDNPADW